jgi:hypothetical protein
MYSPCFNSLVILQWPVYALCLISVSISIMEACPVFSWAGCVSSPTLAFFLAPCSIVCTNESPSIWFLSVNTVWAIPHSSCCGHPLGSLSFLGGLYFNEASGEKAYGRYFFFWELSCLSGVCRLFCLGADSWTFRLSCCLIPQVCTPGDIQDLLGQGWVSLRTSSVLSLCSFLLWAFSSQ